MKIYKYRDFSNPTEDSFRHLEASIHRHLIWCARPDTLNDPEEFVWKCIYTATPETLNLLTEVLVRARRSTPADARRIAEVATRSGRLQDLVAPVINNMIKQCRDQVGLACFGSAPDKEILWQRYGGHGAGVCIEFQVPDDLLGKQLHRVQYLSEKRLHFDQLMRAFVDNTYGQEVYDAVLLAKPLFWADEEEIRFVSQRHSISVAIDRAQVTSVFLGNSLKTDVRERIRWITAPVAVANRV